MCDPAFRNYICFLRSASRRNRESQSLHVRGAAKKAKCRHHCALVDSSVEERGPNVRYLAAMQLAQDQSLVAVGAIQNALASETVPRTRVNLALALGLLGDPVGRKELLSICADKTYVPEFRLYAVRYMFDLHFNDEQECLSATEQGTTSENIGDRVSALSLLTQFHVDGKQAEVRDILVTHLSDSEPTVRLAAANALLQMHDLAAIPFLRQAIAVERDASVRAALQSALDRF